MRLGFCARLIAALLVLLLAGATDAAAGGWGGSDNPDWNATSTGVGTGRCAAITSNSFTGTLKGDDGLGVNATIGFTVLDAQGRYIDLGTGCVTPGAYGTILQLNHWVGYAGAPIGSIQRDSDGLARGYVSANWSIVRLPANADVIWIETYTRAYTGSPCGMGCAGDIALSKYGWTNRREVQVTAHTTVNLVASRTPRFGGRTGIINVKLLNVYGYLTDPRTCAASIKTSCVAAHAWSINTPEGAMVQGWGPGIRTAFGQWQFPSLASGQRYRIWFDFYDARGAFSRRVQVISASYPGFTTQAHTII